MCNYAGTIGTTIALWGWDSRLVSSLLLFLHLSFSGFFFFFYILRVVYFSTIDRSTPWLKLSKSFESCSHSLRVPHTYLPCFLWHNLLHLQNHMDGQLCSSNCKTYTWVLIMHIFKACEACVCGVRGVLMPHGCPARYKTFLQGHSWNICQNTLPSNFFHSHFSSFQHEGHSASFFFLLCIFLPFLIQLSLHLIAFVSSHINTAFCRFIFHPCVTFKPPLLTQSPALFFFYPTTDDCRGRHFFPLSYSQCFHPFFFPSPLFHPCTSKTWFVEQCNKLLPPNFYNRAKQVMVETFSKMTWVTKQPNTPSSWLSPQAGLTNVEGMCWAYNLRRRWPLEF